MTLEEKCSILHDLHQAGCFVIPNPWDPGGAVLLEQLGFRALATTSSGFAWSLGHADNQVTLEDALSHYRAMSAAVRLPISADFEGAFAVEPPDVAANVTAAAATGIAGLSIEDSSKIAASPLYDFDLAVERVRAARQAIDRAPSGARLVLTARSEGFIVGRPDLDETIRRLSAYSEAGADCVFAPGIRDRAHIQAIVTAVAPTPVNVLVSSDFTTVAELAELGVRRISVGGALARAAWGGFLRAAEEIVRHGTFIELTRGVPSAEFDRRFGG
ncbi:MAG TPA: isocitrate lyase/phosphoenolpyruvate mutase family protein [Vicinamibacterales bacterium]|jgi:2-methylisocitrate lyase-like PEP mutase family enzyme|nr:isocitrate lyase/phosphoenolpyruvate mutase family protein [Vicinamibacterales bacterium]